MTSVPDTNRVAKELTGESPGRALYSLRREKEVSLEVIHEKTLIPVWKLKALESDDYDQIGGRPFVIGYIRQVAKLLGADPEPLVLRFNEITKPKPEVLADAQAPGAASPAPNPILPKIRSLWNPWTLLTVVVVWVSAVWLFNSDSDSDLQVTHDSAAQETLEEPPEEELTPETETLVSRPSLNVPVTQGQRPAVLGADVPPAVSEIVPAEEIEIASPASGAFASVTSDAVAGVNTAAETPVEQTVTSQEGSVVTQVISTPEPVSAAVAVVETTPEPVAPARPVVPREPQQDIRGSADSGEDLLEMRFSGQCWVEIRDSESKRLVAKLYDKGDNLQLFSAGPFDVKLGNARVVQLTMNGREVPTTPRGTRNTMRLQVTP